MHIIRFPRPRFRMALAVVALTGLLLTATTVGSPAGATPSQVPPALRSLHWYIDADTLSVVNADDDDCYLPSPFGCIARSDGDEPMIGVVAFRTKLGVPGSTQAWKLNNLHELCSKVEGGEPPCSIPDVTGRAHFGNVQRPSAAQLDAGVAPELIGTIQVTFDNDGTPDDIMNGIMNRLRDGTHQELAAASESLTSDQVRDPSTVASRFVGIGDRIESYTELAWWQKLGIWIGSGGDPDDKVDYRVTLGVGVGRDLADMVNLVLLANFYTLSNGVPVPSGKIVPFALGPRDLTFTHANSGVRYDVSERILSVWE